MPGLTKLLSTWEPLTFERSVVSLPKHLPKVCRKVIRELAPETLSTPDKYDLAEVYNRIRAALAKRGGLKEVSRGDLKSGVWVVFSDAYGPRLADNKRFLRAYLRLIHQRLPGFRARLGCFLSFLEEYPSDAKCFKYSLKWIGELLKASAPNKRFDPIRKRIVEHQLLDPGAPGLIAKKLLSLDRASVREAFLQDVFLDEKRAYGQFARAVFRAATAEIKTEGSLDSPKVAVIDSFLDYTILRLEDRKRMRFASERASVAESLLGPWASRKPPEPLRKKLKAYFLEFYDDPRTNPGSWIDISESSKHVMLGWLVEETLEDFLTVVDLSMANDPDALRQWPYRKAFWRAYQQAGHVTEAWLALARDLESLAARRLDKKKGTYASLKEGVKPFHAVLLLRIDDFVIAEWSHVGKYRVWREDNPNCPAFYKAQYSGHMLRHKSNYDGSHVSPETYSWQRRLADYLRTRTGINVSEFSYRV